MPKPKNGLTEKQLRFIEEYLLNPNGAQAAIKAGYSKKTARQIAEENLSKPDIKRRIDEHRKARQEKFEITEEKIVMELAAIAFSDVGMVADWDAKSMAAIPKDKMSDQGKKFLVSIEKITIGQDVEKVTVKTLAGDKVKALQLLGEHIGMWSGLPKSATSGDDLKDALLELDEEEATKKPSN